MSSEQIDTILAEPAHKTCRDYQREHAAMQVRMHDLGLLVLSTGDKSRISSLLGEDALLGQTTEPIT